MTTKTTIATTTVLAMLGLAGCSGGPGAEMAPLDEPAMVTTHSAEKQSQITMYQMGATNPEGALVTDLVSNAKLRMMVASDSASIEELTIDLADVDLAPNASNPTGVKLRKQQLQIAMPVTAAMTQQERDAVSVHGQSTLIYTASRLLDDGSMTSLGSVQSNPAQFDVRATRYESGVHVTIDAGPQGECWSIPGVVDVSDCSIYIETDGEAQSVGK